MAACAQCSATIEADARFCGSCGTLADASGAPGETGDPWLGRVIDRRYRVTGRLGSGGMGIVYRVEHLHLGKTAAMKVLAPDGAAKPDMVRRFRNEAQAVSKLDHPNIVQTFDFGQCDGALYLVMEYINGEDLSALIRRDGPWSFARAARLFVQVCSGLVEAHEAGIVHRDLKPENLMVVRRRDGAEHVKVLDFGLAKLRERATDPSSPNVSAVSSAGQVIGTPYYMAPEQVRGEPLDARADLYSVGATLYRVLTGVPPFDAPSPMSVLAKHLTDEVVPPRTRAPERALPPEADRIVLRAMAKSPADRYPSAIAMREDLERALGESGAATLSAPSLSAPPSPSELEPVPVSRADAPTVPIDDSDIVDNMADRLRRSDVDDYEWGLRRRRLLTRILVPLAVLAAIAGGVALWTRFGGERAALVESEPNNTPGYANLLPLGAPLRGTIGKRGADGQGDVDYFRIPAGKGVRAVDARLEGIPNVDLVLELYDAQGRRVAKSDEHGKGWGEWLQPTTIGPGEAYLAVRELWVEGLKPTEDAPDPYALTARWGPPQVGWEVEPNDWPVAATPLGAPGRVRGYLGRADDRDWFEISVDHACTLTGSVTAPAGVDLVLLRDPEGKRPIDKQGAGGSEEFALLARPGTPVLIGIARKLPLGPDLREQPLQGLDDPYELKVEIAPL
ncbi:MAG TPA: serine/threonine-protein kinase [Polyangia bacterium]|jgi:serine/threonine-protein kinase|nr:serine/threonine-protein kinase [Polyangia bacterium]